ncbi:MAG TPA: phosphoribosylamine--glycine ligase [Spirochaetota bacterium]|nr:phosphoribosylamine--glycine ligase [Spirochaetota bacterium]HOS32860.1 phosphoribosylamine--glycine ligase [Spirochaetota bacterium]HOS55309.1 phosphoribosylamine--glycine ligase [Spirochaetota bacterium]HPK62929.1 phosphoribosylamine--glycine ligase [Spirochaetota bacterium]HQF76908.1 phosphoribosylamine--glycine ligase [Spirochaetota bacterium]
MNVLLIGSGGREHAIAKKLIESPKLTKLYSIPGNPGISSISETIGTDLKIDSIVKLAKEKSVDLIFCGPEQPLVDGLSDLAEKKSGIKTFGPSKMGAALEGSKIFSKQFMSKYDIPTSDYKYFYNYDEAVSYFKRRKTYPVVIKADGLAAGKGVKIAKNREEADEIIKSYFIDKSLGKSGESIVIEEFLTGEEMSAIYITDGTTFLPLIAAKDYKKVYDDDKGENTGGMGAYAPHLAYTDELKKIIEDNIISKIKIGLKKEGIDYRGALYVGLMLTDEGPKVIEFNCRFGDPETQVILPLMDSDLLNIANLAAGKKLSGTTIKWKNSFAGCVVIASEGYPGDYKKGVNIEFSGNPFDFIHAGTKQVSDKIVTNGGRVLNAVSIGSSKSSALLSCYKLLEKVKFDGCFYRKDIGT